eukprot:12416148-Alexandrium_andersonii.AAC.1
MTIAGGPHGARLPESPLGRARSRLLESIETFRGLSAQLGALPEAPLAAAALPPTGGRTLPRAR